MSADDTASEIVEEGENPAPAKKPRFSRKMMIIAGAVIALLLVAGGAAFFLMKPAEGEAAAAEAPAEGHGGGEAGGGGGGHGGEEGVAYVDAPAMVVNLQGAEGTARFLKIRFTFVPASAAKGELIKTKLPLIVDSFQPFLRELRPEDLAGSAAVFRIKEEMLVRATSAMGPGVVDDILIQDLIQQ